jgi:hypothetical protein
MSRSADKLKGCDIDESEGLVSRWSRRKTEQRAVADENTVSSEMPTDELRKVDQASEHSSKQPTDADMPPLDSLGEESDYSGFMSPKVSEELRTLALRKLFHLPQFNVTDGLNDYDEDYTSFAKLGNVITHEMRRLRELEKRLTVKAKHDEIGDGEQRNATSESSDPSQSEDSLIPESDADAKKADEIGGDEKDESPLNQDPKS